MAHRRGRLLGWSAEAISLVARLLPDPGLGALWLRPVLARGCLSSHAPADESGVPPFATDAAPLFPPAPHRRSHGPLHQRRGDRGGLYRPRHSRDLHRFGHSRCHVDRAIYPRRSPRPHRAAAHPADRLPRLPLRLAGAEHVGRSAGRLGRAGGPSAGLSVRRLRHQIVRPRRALRPQHRGPQSDLPRPHDRRQQDIHYSFWSNRGSRWGRGGVGDLGGGY